MDRTGSGRFRSRLPLEPSFPSPSSVNPLSPSRLAPPFPAHAVGFRDHFTSDSQVLEQSVLLLFLQACLQARPDCVLISSAFTTEEYAQLCKSPDNVLKMQPRRQTLVLIPMTPNKLGEALTFIAELIMPPVVAEGDRQQQHFKKRPAKPNIVPGLADWRRINSPTQLAKAAQVLINDSVQSVEHLLTVPNMNTDAQTIESSPDFRGHMLHYCNAERQIGKHGSDIISDSGTPVPFQRHPPNYFYRENDSTFFNPIEEFDELSCVRALNPLDQAMLFGDNPDANNLLRMHFPTMQAPLPSLKSLFRHVIEGKTRKSFAEVETVHLRSFVLNGLSMREIKAGNQESEFGRIIADDESLPIERRFPDPQQTAMLRDLEHTEAEATVDRNSWLTQIGYPAQFRVQQTMGRMLDDARKIENVDERFAAVQRCYQVGFSQLHDALSDPSNKLFPESVNKLYRERIALRDQMAKMKLEDKRTYNAVQHMIRVNKTTANFGGDTTARLLTHTVMLLQLRLGAMSNQMYPMIMGLLLVWNMIISYDNEKHAAALIGTASSGKSQMWEWIHAMMNRCLFKMMGDQTAAAENYTEMSELDFVLRFWDEKDGIGGGKRSSEMADSRQGATMKTMLAEGYVTNHKPEKVLVNGRETLKSVAVVTPARGTSIFLRNTKGKDGPIESRLHDIHVNDPPTTEHRNALLKNAADKTVLQNLWLAGQSVGVQQLLLHLPGHAGLDSGCDQSLLAIAMTVYLKNGLQPPMGRQLKQLRRLVRSVTCHRVAGEMTRIEEISARFAKMDDWEKALIMQAHQVASPADIIAGLALYYGCAGHDTAWDDIMETLVSMLQRTYASSSSSGDDDGGAAAEPQQMTGFATHKGTHYILNRTGTTRGMAGRTEEMLCELASSIYTKQKTAKGGETASQPVIIDVLRDLMDHQVDGVPALGVIEWQEKEGSSTELRWAVSQTMLHTASLPHMRQIAINISKLQQLRMHRKPARNDFYTQDEEHWVIPIFSDDPVYCGNVVLKPHEFLTFPNTSMKEVASALVALNPGAASKRGQGRMKESDYDHRLRFFERMHSGVFEITQSNEYTAYRKIDPSVAPAGCAMSEDGEYALERKKISGQCMVVRIDAFNEIVRGTQRPNAFKKASNIVRAIMLPEEALDENTMTNYWMGLERDDEGRTSSKYLEPEDLTDVTQVMRDLTFQKETDETRAYIGELEEDDDDTLGYEKIWPGDDELCTFSYGDDLYGKALKNNFIKMGLVGHRAEEYYLNTHLCLAPSRKRKHDQ